jgi:hypothetical protein
MSLTKRISVWVLGVVVFILWSLAMMVAWSETPVMVVSGTVRDGKGAPLNGWAVTVENTTRNWKDTAISGTDGPGVYSVVHLELFGDAAADVGDIIKARAVSPDKLTTLDAQATLTREHIEAANVNLDLGGGIVSPMQEDVSQDGVIDILDLVIVAQAFGSGGVGLAADVNQDGVVDILDLVLVARRFGEAAVAATASRNVGGQLDIASTLQTTLRESEIAFNVALRNGADGTSIDGYAVDVAFDPSLLHFQGLEEGNMFGETAFRYLSDSAELARGRVRLMSVRIGDATADPSQPLAQARFHILGNPQAAMTSLRVQQVMFGTREGQRLLGKLQTPTRLTLLTSGKGTLAGTNYPNPFNPETWIPYQLAEESAVRVRIFTDNGQLVRELNLGVQPAGGYVTRDRAAYWDGKNALGETVSSGLYFYEFRAGNYAKVGRMLILK